MTQVYETIKKLQEIHGIGEVFLLEIRKLRKDLETPPGHKWEHGDVFRNSSNVEMIYIELGDESAEVFCLSDCTGHHKPELWLKDGKFLFNIKEKL